MISGECCSVTDFAIDKRYSAKKRFHCSETQSVIDLRGVRLVARSVEMKKIILHPRANSKAGMWTLETARKEMCTCIYRTS